MHVLTILLILKTFLFVFSVVEKNEGSKLSSTWRPANDYVNLKVGEGWSIKMRGNIANTQVISLLPNIFSASIKKGTKV